MPTKPMSAKVLTPEEVQQARIVSGKTTRHLRGVQELREQILTLADSHEQLHADLDRLRALAPDIASLLAQMTDPQPSNRLFVPSAVTDVLRDVLAALTPKEDK